jgi:ATP-dependent helicase HrpB
VVDSGYEKVARYDSERAIDSLRRERITQAAADQRAGRAGRLAPGIVYRLWESTDRLRPHREPDIQRVDLCGIALDVLAWGTDPRTLDWFEAPRPESLEQALRLLERIGAVSGLHLTDIGRVMQRLAVPPRLARILVEGCGERAIVRAVATIAERHYLPPRPESSASDLFFVLDHWDTVPEHIRRVASDLEASLRHEISAPVAGPGVEARLCRAVLAGYPDRIAQRREPASSRFLLATGTGAILSRESAVRDAEFVVALDVRTVDDAYATESRITLASAVERDWLAPTGTDVEYTVDDRGFVRAREIERYDALRLAERPIAPDTERAADVLATAYLERPLSDADRRLIRRAEFAGCHIELAALVRAAAYGVRSLAEIDITRVLPRDVADTIARNAPLTLALPSGRRAALEYGEDGTMSAEVKLQELFGLAETPRVGPRREPVLLSLLAPNGRPVQVTRDLRSFWDRTYPEVRKELRGRYPKHPWPEDPWNAVPTHRTKPRSQS